jgi:PAS domain S-box-containing protein
MTPDKPNPALWTDDERWQILMENVKDFAIFMLDPQGRIVTWSSAAERILGYKEEEILGHNFCQIFTPHDIEKEQPQRELQDAREKGRAEDERWHLRKDGSRLWASGVVTPLRDDQGALRGFVKVLRDITERKRYEERLAEENQRKDEFLAMLSHELRNPLAAIANSTQILRLDNSQTGNEAATIIERQVNGLVQLVNDLTDVSRISTGKIQVHIERVRLNDVITRAIESVRHIVDARKHELAVSMSSEAIWVDADPHRLEQALANLLNNAAKYTDPGGRIRLTVERVGNEAFVRLKDNGAGIAAEMLDRIFDLFIQADRSLDRSQGGLGIGLTLVRRLVEMQGGKVEAFSDGVGHGSEFVVRLPVMPEVVAPSGEPLSKPVRPSSRLRLLLAEDNPDTAKTMAMLLRALGHEVDVVHDGSAAVQAVEKSKPDALLIDIGLPKLNGYEVAERLRQQPNLSDVRIIAISGYSQPKDYERSKLAGIDHHLVKPVSVETLQDVLSRAMGGNPNAPDQ